MSVTPPPDRLAPGHLKNLNKPAGDLPQNRYYVVGGSFSHFTASSLKNICLL